MDRGTWQATVHGIAELDGTDRLSLSQFYYLYMYLKQQSTGVYLCGDFI